MKPARIIVLAIAVVAGGIAALLAGRSEPPPPPPVAQLETTDDGHHDVRENQVRMHGAAREHVQCVSSVVGFQYLVPLLFERAVLKAHPHLSRASTPMANGKFGARHTAATATEFTRRTTASTAEEKEGFRRTRNAERRTPNVP